MKSLPSVIMIMQELQSLKSEMSELKSLSIKQTEILNKFGFYVEEELTPAPVHEIETAHTHQVESLDYKISMLLQELKIPASIKGYSLLREAIKLVYQDGRMIRVTKFLYPMLAKQFSTTASRAERAIRHAIEISYDKNYFHPLYQRCYVDCKPSNAQFIAMIVENFKMEEQVEFVSAAR